MSTGNAAGLSARTSRDRDYPAIRQFTVFVENRVGKLLEILRRFEGSKVRIVALSITEATEGAIIRLMVSHPEQGRELLELAGLQFIETDLLGVELPEGPQPLARICMALLQVEVNIHQVYPFLVQPHGRSAVALQIDNIEMATDTLASKKFVIVHENDLKHDE
ncbi:MAG TPA: acetolactate synthase [Pirellulales bacterium]